MISSPAEFPRFKVVNFTIDKDGRLVRTKGAYMLVYEHELYVVDDGSYVKAVCDALNSYKGELDDQTLSLACASDVERITNKAFVDRVIFTRDRSEANRLARQHSLQTFEVHGNPEYFRGSAEGVSYIS